MKPSSWEIWISRKWMAIFFTILGSAVQLMIFQRCLEMLRWLKFYIKILNLLRNIFFQLHSLWSWVEQQIEWKILRSSLWKKLVMNCRLELSFRTSLQYQIAMCCIRWLIHFCSTIAFSMHFQSIQWFNCHIYKTFCDPLRWAQSCRFLMGLACRRLGSCCMKLSSWCITPSAKIPFSFDLEHVVVSESKVELLLFLTEPLMGFSVRFTSW